MGNSGIDNYLSYGLTESGKQYAGNPSWYLSSLSNPNLTWETLENLNIGLNATLFDRFSFNIEFYNKLTKNMLMYIPYSFQTGFAGGWGNVMANVPEGTMSMFKGYDLFAIISLVIMYVATFSVGQEAVSRFYAARDEKAAMADQSSLQSSTSSMHSFRLFSVSSHLPSSTWANSTLQTSKQ
jgi:hypothetical protein